MSIRVSTGTRIETIVFSLLECVKKEEGGFDSKFFEFVVEGEGRHSKVIITERRRGR